MTRGEPRTDRARHGAARAGRDGGPGGFTLVETLVYLLVSTVLVLAVYGVLITQSQGYRVQDQRTDLQNAMRTAGHVLTWELRQSSPQDGDLLEMEQTRVVLRSTKGSGVVCDRRPASRTYAITGLAGSTPFAGDSVLIFQPGDVGPDDDAWGVYDVQQASSGGALPAGNCSYPDAPAAEAAVQVRVAGNDTAAIAVGAPIRVFEAVTYASFVENDRTWLGRRVGNGSWTALAGPLRGSDGLEFRYLEASGAAATDPRFVTSVEIILRGAIDGNQQQDSVVLKAWPRG